MRAVVAVFFVVGACAHGPRAPATTVHMDPIVFVAGKTGEVVVRDPAELFERAAVAYQADRYDEALGLYDRVVAEHPGTRHARSSLYNAGLSLEQLGRRSEAAQRFRRLADEAGEGPEALDALFRLGTNLVLLK